MFNYNHRPEESEAYVILRHWISNPNGDIKTTTRVRAKDYGIQHIYRGSATTLLITYNGRTQFLTQWATEIGILQSTLSTRLGRFGWSIERALTTPCQKNSEIELTHNGITLTLSGWAERIGLSKETLLKRRRRGLPVEEILSTACRGEKYEHKGESRTVRGWAEVTGLDENTLLARLRNGWTIEEALETKPLPRGTKRRSKKSLSQTTNLCLTAKLP